MRRISGVVQYKTLHRPLSLFSLAETKTGLLSCWGIPLFSTVFWNLSVPKNPLHHLCPVLIHMPHLERSLHTNVTPKLLPCIKIIIIVFQMHDEIFLCCKFCFILIFYFCEDELVCFHVFTYIHLEASGNYYFSSSSILTNLFHWLSSLLCSVSCAA